VSRFLAAVAAFGVITAGCGMSADSPDPADALKAGQWGGQHIAMTVAASATEIEFDCGKAAVEGPIDVARDGAFSATGTFLPERPGPTTPDAPPRRPMRLSGTVKGDDMQARVVLTDRDEEVGAFSLAFGASARLLKCR